MDSDYCKKVMKLLAENNNYCPSKKEHIKENKCMCKKFRDMIFNKESGYCDCGLYKLIQD